MELVRYMMAPMLPEAISSLVTGKACCNLENDSEWDWVWNYYLKNRERRIKQ